MFDLHTHSIFSDGHALPSEMADAAIAKGLSALGLSDHGYTPFDLSYCMRVGRIPDYFRIIGNLKKEYAGRVEVLCGVEQDYFSTEPVDDYDYVIGSCHYIFHSGTYYTVDGDVRNLINCANDAFHGDLLSVAEAYFDMVADVIHKTGANIIGHFDLVAKYNEKAHLFDEHCPRYVKAWQTAVDALLKTGAPFEINTGAISRGARTIAYPTREMLTYINERGGTVLLSSDAHTPENIAYAFDTYDAMAREIGFGKHYLSEPPRRH